MEKAQVNVAIDQYLELQTAIHNYFGYVEDWRVIPLDDRREMFWAVSSETEGEVVYSPEQEQLKRYLDTGALGDKLFADEIYTQRFLPQWVYRAADFTLCCVDTHTDGNKFLAIFDNAKETQATT